MRRLNLSMGIVCKQATTLSLLFFLAIDITFLSVGFLLNEKYKKEEKRLETKLKKRGNRNLQLVVLQLRNPLKKEKIALFIKKAQLIF